MNSLIKKAGQFTLHTVEAFVWIAVIVFFAFTSPDSSTHFTICPLSQAGFEYCPGCGLGRSIVLLLHGEVVESFRMHPLAAFALAVFSIRIAVVFTNYSKYLKQLNYSIEHNPKNNNNLNTTKK